MKKYKKGLEGLPISTERIKGKGADAKDLRESMQAATPLGRVERLRPLAEKFGLTDLLTRAESLIDPAGCVVDREAFNDTLELILSRAGRSVNQSEVFPLARKGIVVGKPGGHAMKIKAEEIQEKALNEVLKHGKIEGNFFKIMVGDWQNSCKIANENVYPSAPTIKKYKDFIEKELTKQNGKKILLHPYK